MSDVTQILNAIERGDPHAADELLPIVYGELRKLAAAKLSNERVDQTLQATALVHEAFLPHRIGITVKVPSPIKPIHRLEMFANRVIACDQTTCRP